MLIIIFWILLLLWLIGAFDFVPATHPSYPVIVRGRNVVLLVLFAILGYYTFGF